MQGATQITSNIQQLDSMAARVAEAEKYAAELVHLAKRRFYGTLTVTFKDGTILKAERSETIKL